MCDTSVYRCYLKPGAQMGMHREVIARTVSSEMPIVNGLRITRILQMKQK